MAALLRRSASNLRYASGCFFSRLKCVQGQVVSSINDPCQVVKSRMQPNARWFFQLLDCHTSGSVSSGVTDERPFIRFSTSNVVVSSHRSRGGRKQKKNMEAKLRKQNTTKSQAKWSLLTFRRQLIMEARRLIKINFFGPLDEQRLDGFVNGLTPSQYRTKDETYMVIRKMVQLLDDPYSEFIPFPSTLSNVPLQSLTVKYKCHNIGYVRFTAFYKGVSDELEHALSKISKETKFLVLDLRGNEGGRVDEGIEVIKLLHPVGNMFTIDEKGRKYTDHNDIAFHDEMIVVILIDPKTFSCGEFVSSVLGHSGASIIGFYTVGKDKIISSHTLQDGSVLDLTCAKWTNMSGLSTNKVGVKPRHPIPLDCPTPQTIWENLRSKQPYDLMKLFELNNKDVKLKKKLVFPARKNSRL